MAKPAGRARTWSFSRTASQPMLRRKKSPSMLRRDQRRKAEFLAKKAAQVEPVDEITLTEIPIDKTEVSENEIINIVGENKNRNLWKSIDEANKKIGIKEIGEGSTCFEHYYEFWGSWKIENGSKLTIEVLRNPSNWPKETKIRDVNVRTYREPVRQFFLWGLPNFFPHTQNTVQNILSVPSFCVRIKSIII